MRDTGRRDGARSGFGRIATRQITKIPFGKLCDLRRVTVARRRDDHRARAVPLRHIRAQIVRFEQRHRFRGSDNSATERVYRVQGFGEQVMHKVIRGVVPLLDLPPERLFAHAPFLPGRNENSGTYRRGDRARAARPRKVPVRSSRCILCR